jgi:DNA-directed RNA polymerase subunit alpha
MLDQIKFSVEEVEEKGPKGKFIISPLPSGFGHTVGHSLRRTLLGEFPGAAAITFKLKGVDHVFSTLEGVKEDVIEIMLNVKQIKFNYDGDKPVKVKINKEGPGKVTAGDIVLQPNVEVSNPDLVLATLADKSTVFNMEINVSSGSGYQPAEKHDPDKHGIIPVDAVFTPIINANYQVEQTRRDEKSDLDKLALELETDGTISPKEALEKASEIIAEVFGQIVNPKGDKRKKKKEEPKTNDNYDLMIEEIEEVPLRLSNALKKAGYKTVNDLSKSSPDEISEVRNVGQKSVQLLKEVMDEMGVDFEN